MKSKKNKVLEKFKEKDIILKTILDKEIAELESMVRFDGASSEQTDKLIMIIRGFAVIVTTRVVKIKLWINTISILVAAALAYAIIK